MNDKALPATATSASPFPVVIAGLVAIAVFIVDTLTPLDIAIAVLYVVVVLLAANYFERRGVLMVSLGCISLTVLSFLLTHGFVADESLARCVVSVAAIGATTFLALQNSSASMTLRGQARLLDLTHDTIFVRNMSDVITYWNRGAEELYGWSADEAVGKVTHQILKTGFPAPLNEIMEALLSNGRWEGELIHTRCDGTRVAVASRWSLQQDERGRPVAIMETNNDITARNQAQAALRILDHQPADLDEVRSAVESIVNDGMRASEVVQRLRALTKKTELHMVQLNINDVISDVVRLLQREIFDHSISLQLDLASAAPQVIGDEVQLQQVVINLVMNGMEAMATVSDRSRDLVIRSSLHEADQILVEVQDGGAGIAPENADRLFKAFFTTKPHGMGMGLSICRSIVQAHGGRIWVSANAGGTGTTFQFTVPVAKSDAASS